MNKIMIIDEDQGVINYLRELFLPYYQCVRPHSIKHAITCLTSENVSLVLLEISLSNIDGWTVCKEIRKISNVPIIILTTKKEKKEILTGFKLGADDYIIKPFNEEELLARVEALIRRTTIPKKRGLSFQGLLWDESGFDLTYNGTSIPLTPKEFALLGTMLKKPNYVFSREALLKSIWENNDQTDNRTIDSHIRNIRDKLRQSDYPVDHHLITVWGTGYKWNSNGNL
ncbi:response regulator transcription factor (plasmid) [Cytobacillus firmus]|uniref:Response regulator transcription factor n=2 Tax=Cytobacillus TaxID=2675230 RepID=A0AA46PD75_CYTFI|nr:MULTISPECIES: response regulator transcription factor [Cytobacillus]AND43040.1 DNA-binding response regulator [Cytobacillus oceanisediminis 2691]MCM3244579.1 response regulator transcription factor [Cytobacillus oceanisediminis]USK41722.1 response regulator transcription factor [Cytobacillus firmus]USK47558.1 response regulator transcription factor [Cytobacillus oceanisediminis]UYG98311.1 response regulator transcription factor [Cytobacillus firmus]